MCIKLESWFTCECQPHVLMSSDAIHEHLWAAHGIVPGSSYTCRCVAKSFNNYYDHCEVVNEWLIRDTIHVTESFTLPF